ncbi:MAG: SufD family Fe-S cluster assembly protein [Verrucomicrobia bacterium]|nr:SufD family Fe-S cluster assembly protein [Verrucomicrobiota bacterium]
MSTLTSPALTGILDSALQSADSAEFRAQDWFTILRQQGWHTFQSLPMPKRDDEKWRFSDTRTLSLAGYAVAPAPSDAEVAKLFVRSQFISRPAGLIVHVDGHCIHKPALAPELTAQGVIFESMTDAIRHHPALLKEYLLKHKAGLGGDKFLALHQAWLRSGYLLHIPKGVVVTQPFVSIHWTLAEGAAVFPHALIIADELAQTTIHDFHLSAQPAARALAISACDIYAGNGAKIHRLAVQGWSSTTQSFQIDNTCGGRDALISSVHAAVGSRRARLENIVRIDGPGADIRLYGISVASGEQELFKNALLDKSRTIFSGLIKVAPEAQRTDAYQTNRNLLLSPEAEADSLPGLEIEANDVKCSHGATTGQVNPDELFYLRARGIPLAVAQELLAQGFLEEILAKVENDEAAATVREMLRVKFHQI